MPRTAMETLSNILRLEREQGYKNTAVIGGLAAFAGNWSGEARQQARKPEQHLLIDELSKLLREYDTIESKQDRMAAVAYMDGRMTRRIPPPPEYQAPLETTVEPTQRDMGGEAPTSQDAPKPPERRHEPPRQKEVVANGEPRDANAPRRDRPPDNRDQRKGQGKPQGGQQGGGRPPFQRRGGDDSFERIDYDSSGLDFTPRAGGKPMSDMPVVVQLARPPRKPRQPIEPDRASELLRGLSASVEKIKGVGGANLERLEKLGIRSINDLLFYLPRRYDDYTRMLPIRRLEPNMQVVVIATVRAAEVRVGSGGRKDFYILVEDGTAQMSVTFFRQGAWLGSKLRVGTQIVLRGTTSIYRNMIQMANPDWHYVDGDSMKEFRIVPVYPLTDGITEQNLRKIIHEALAYWADRIPDYMPESTLERADLADIGWMLRQLHDPETFDHLHHAKRRFIFDQLLMLQLAILAQRRAWQSTPSDPLHVTDEWLQAFLSAVLPYELTGAQKRAVADIRADIGKAVPMNRLLQGDVGSGKTAVALTALAMAVANGKQAAIMAPTGILAEQHYRSMSRALENMPGGQRPVVASLTSALTTSERASVLRGLADGSIDVVVGTHSIIQEGVEFKDLGVAVIDEQHRFGVEQRGALRGKAKNPHLLVMTATPIPRTLALTLYADLDLSVIDEMPPGRIPIQTRVIEPSTRERAYNFVEAQLEQGRQAFIVYPLVEASDKIDAEAAVEGFDKLQKIFYNHKVGILHGRMKPSEKDEIMAAFAQKQFDVMVTTSVAEVGVDIPNASIIMIEGANRFGLAQLHQFRGRVGRGGHASYCLLVCDTTVEEARQRLTALEATNDGFKLAEVDWELRGPGDLVGTRQSGGNLIQLVDDMSPDLVALAQREAKTIFEEDPELTMEQHRLLKERVLQLQDDRSDLS